MPRQAIVLVCLVAVSIMEGVSLSVLLIYLIRVGQTDSLVHIHYQNIHGSPMECLTNSSLAATSVVECAGLCTQTESCSYFQQNTSVDDDKRCILCTKCTYSPGALSSLLMMPINTSQIFTGKPIYLQNIMNNTGCIEIFGT